MYSPDNSIQFQDTIYTKLNTWAARFLLQYVCCGEALNLVCKVLIVTLWPLLCTPIGLCRRGCALVNFSLHYDLHCPFLRNVAMASIGLVKGFNIVLSGIKTHILNSL